MASRWQTQGSGMNEHVMTLTVDRTGAVVYAWGWSRCLMGWQPSFVAMWDGARWRALGSGMDNFVWALAVDAVGNLYAGGGFTSAGGTVCHPRRERE